MSGGMSDVELLQSLRTQLSQVVKALENYASDVINDNTENVVRDKLSIAKNLSVIANVLQQINKLEEKYTDCDQNNTAEDIEIIKNFIHKHGGKYE